MQKILPFARQAIMAVMLLLLFHQLNAQAKQGAATITISGRVTDSLKTPLRDVSITQGKRILGLTDDNGKFTVQASPSGKISFSYVGYQFHQVNPTANSNLRVTLKRSGAALQEVVVTALGITREERGLGNATTVITNEQLTSAPAANWTDALSGKVAGLNLIRSNSGPTGSNKIILRGENNLTGDNEALIVLDGVVMKRSSARRTAIQGESVYGTGSDNMPADYGSSLNDINADDIESVTVLKGPGAAALYGQDAANGAIIITTKSGSAKRKGWGVTVNSNFSVEQINRWPDLQYEYGQGLGGAAHYSYGASADGPSTSGTSSAYGPRFNGQMFYQYDPVTQAQGKEGTPWVPYKNTTRDYFETGKTFTNTVSVDGGTDRTTARLSVTNVNNTWITPNTGYKRNTVALSVNSKINDLLQVSAKVNYTNKWSDNLPGAGYGNQSIMYWYIFWMPNADVNWLKNYWQLGQEGRRIRYPFSSFPENPYAIAYEFINSSNRNGITGNVQATYNFNKDLSLQVRSSMDMTYEQRAQKRPYDAGSRYQKGSYRTQNIFAQEVSTDFLLRYSKKINKDLGVTITAGGSQVRNRYNRDELRADSLTIPGLYSMANSLGSVITLPYSSRMAINSLYGVMTTTYKNLLYLDLTARKDWNSVLATPERTENTGFFFPSASMSFILSDAVRLPQDINFAKLRLSASGVGSGSTIPYLTSYNYSRVETFPGGLQNPSLLTNPNLLPLRTITYEAGANVKMFKSRLGVDVAVYVGNTIDQHLQRVLDRASGYTRVLINAGKVGNKGIEVALNGTPVSTKNFKWTSSVVFSANRNRIKELADSSVVLQTGPVGGGQLVAQVGGSMGDLYGRGYLRAPDGQVVYDGTTGFAQLTQDVVYLGNTIPKGKIGFTNQFTYKQFRLNLLFDAQYGAVAHSLMHYKLSEQGKTTNTLPGRYNGIIGNGVVMGTDGKYVPNTVIATDIDEYYRSHFGIDNAEGSTFSTDFIKFREARLDYTLNPRLTKKLGLQRATFGIYGRDLFIWSPWPMFDPEFGTLSGSDIVRGFETAQFPSTRTIGCNLVIGL
ncbi:SusC/RagA family TonB-linked outer membrane protein [Aridibaculum aurantiacum]|uniref:SusC/RagA family TonB-linked outer membrane protein n=1 Tax=Aridibaculum aurantiacum TaxID=2810307 RepID=UPI001A974A13|nr:SusC/RagA family TonB-linked outer membrane protein [Aridibaculum aurantiacum]